MHKQFVFSSNLVGMKTIKRISSVLAAAMLLVGTACAQEQKSPAKEVKGEANGVGVEVVYCAPSVRDRDIYGDLVPYDKVWRAGANEATTVKFDEDCKVAGKDIKAGMYAFFVKPTKNGDWEVMFNSEAKQWGAYKMDAKKNVVVAKVKVQDADKLEQLAYTVSDNGIILHWDNKMIAVPVSK